MPCNEVITSNNVLIQDNNHSTSSVWEWKASLSPKSWEKMSHNPVKKYLDPDRPETKFPDLTSPDPKIFFKMFPDRFWSGAVRSRETQSYWLPRRSLFRDGMIFQSMTFAMQRKCVKYSILKKGSLFVWIGMCHVLWKEIWKITNSTSPL